MIVRSHRQFCCSSTSKPPTRKWLSILVCTVNRQHHVKWLYLLRTGPIYSLHTSILYNLYTLHVLKFQSQHINLYLYFIHDAVSNTAWPASNVTTAQWIRKTGKTPGQKISGILVRGWRTANRRSYQDGEDNRQTVSGDKRGSSNWTAVSNRTVHLSYKIPCYTAHISCLKGDKHITEIDVSFIQDFVSYFHYLRHNSKRRIHPPRLLVYNKATSTQWWALGSGHYVPLLTEKT